VSQEAPSERLSVVWAPEARAELRQVDRNAALDVLHCLDRYLQLRAGDVKKLRPPRAGFRLRCGDFRLFFDLLGEQSIAVTGVRHRRDAYR
jgi:mRNA-degrading endonuclease RelE of RelBE toxin-antitoxin system